MEKNILSKLNETQKMAVTHGEGPAMVLAGAGSGKTRVLTYRIAHLITQGVEPFCILSLTFTNKAAKEMKERVVKILGNSEGKNVWMGTFHSIFARILRFEGERLGYPSNFTIYDTDDSKRLIKKVIKEQNLDDKVYQPNYVLNRISGAKSSLISVHDYMADIEIQQMDKQLKKPFLGTLYKLYVQRCYKSGAMDFDDLLFNMHILLRDFPELLLKYQKKFSHVLVDEFQDTNYAQYMILKKLCADNENIFVVGDDAQSIYGFRGANIANILNLKKDFPDLQTYKLEQNYRSTQNIVNAANSLIEKNKNQLKKTIWTQNFSGEKIQITKASTDGEEGRLVVESIFNKKMNLQKQNKDFAILYRTNAQSRTFEESLRKHNIPYKIYGGLSFYQRKEIKDVLAYFRLTINPKDEEALLRVINYPARGIGKTTQEKLIALANDHQKSIWQILLDINQFASEFNAGTANKLNDFTNMIKSFSALSLKKPAYDLAHHIIKASGISKEMNDDKTPEGISRYENIEELLNGVKEFSELNDEISPGTESVDSSLGAYMQDIALLTDSDTKDKEQTDRVSLMTIHSAKGLEFPFVFIVGMEEELFPSAFSLNSREELEEERRLFYVALTRAMQEVSISYATYRYKWGNLIACQPSRFIHELDKQLLIYDKNQLAALKQQVNKKMDAKANPPTHDTSKLTAFKNLKTDNTTLIANNQIQTGMLVEHKRFGKGKVLKIEGNGGNKKAMVFFKNFGEKQLLLKFAQLKIIE